MTAKKRLPVPVRQLGDFNIVWVDIMCIELMYTTCSKYLLLVVTYFAKEGEQLTNSWKMFKIS